MITGAALGKLLSVESRAAYLISTGTAICGGSAIAAVGPVLGATEDEMSVSLGTVFLLNSVALLAFPVIGAALKLSQTQFGLWAALAIHDTSSVVGACAKVRGRSAGNRHHREAGSGTVDRARYGCHRRVKTGSKTRIQWPWFILFFCLAAMANTYLLAGFPVYQLLSKLGKLLLIFTLFLIGATLSPAALRKVGPRPLIQGVLLWLLVGAVQPAWRFAPGGSAFKSDRVHFIKDRLEICANRPFHTSIQFLLSLQLGRIGICAGACSGSIANLKHRIRQCTRTGPSIVGNRRHFLRCVRTACEAT